MTPALKAMVEAMLADVRRQHALDVTATDPPAQATVVFVNGVVNLEKVARAGLEAIREPTESMITESYWSALAEDGPEVWRDMIDDVLKDAP